MSTDKIAALRRTALFNELEEETLRALAERAIERRFQKDELLFVSGDEAHGLYVIVEGAVRAFRESADGREQVIHVERAGATIAEVPVFDDGAFPSMAAAETDSVLLFIDKRDVRSLCLEHPQIALAALKVLAGRLRRCAELVETLSLREVGQRLARFLLAQARARGHTGDSFMPAPVNHRRPVLLGLTASAGLTALIIIGSRNLEHYDAALFGYTVASVVAFGAIIFRYVIWLQRPATRRYWLRGWQLFRERKKLLANTKSATATATKNLIAQKFIFKRGSTRWLIHFLIMWGCVLSALITFPLVFGWVHFKLEGAQGCRPYVFGFPMPLMQGEYNPPAETPDEEYPLILTSGRVVYQYLSGNQTRRIGFLVQQCPEPYVEVHPETAMKLKINDGEHVRVRSRRGEGIFPVLVVRTIRPDTIFIPYHWGEQLAANQLTNPALDPTSKIPEFNACAARIEKIHSRKLPIMGAQRKGASQSEAIRG